ncbi:MAG: hypothetical protein JXQ93_10190 [Flavobacteriaceae bacterium]
MNNPHQSSKFIYFIAIVLFSFSVQINAQNSQQLYNKIQGIYANYATTSKSNCSKAKRLVRQLQPYTGSKYAVPSDKAYSVNYPRKVNNPTIGDLAKDRIARLKSQFKSCFQNKQESNPTSTRLYNEVQNIYIEYRNLSSNNCDKAKKLVDRLFAYSSYTYLVPSSKAYSVNFPKKVVNPKIGDLAKDRIARIKNHVKACFTGEEVSRYIHKNITGTWKYIHNGREFHLRIVKDGTTVKASFPKHGYSYPPIYKGAKMITNNGVGLNFALGNLYQVTFQVYHNEMGVSAYISESWENNGVLKSIGVLQRVRRTPKPKPASLVKVDITFLNQTKTNAVVYWVNNGKETKYKTLKPGEAYVQGTYSTHNWRVRVNNRMFLNYKTTKDKSQLVRIK